MVVSSFYYHNNFWAIIKPSSTVPKLRNAIILLPDTITNLSNLVDGCVGAEREVRTGDIV